MSIHAEAMQHYVNEAVPSGPQCSGIAVNAFSSQQPSSVEGLPKKTSPLLVTTGVREIERVLALALRFSERWP